MTEPQAMPDTPQAVLAAAVAHHGQGRLSEAEPLYRRALAARPGDEDANHNLVVLLLQSGRVDAARQALDDWRAVGGAGHAFDEIEMAADPVAVMRRRLNAAPASPAAHSDLGVAHERVGAWDEAAASYRRAIDLAPGWHTPRFNLGNVLHRQGRAEEAVASFRVALVILPDDVSTHGNLGNSLRRLGRTLEALEAYRRAVTLDPTYATGHANLGGLLRALGRFDEAAGHLRRALNLTGGDAGVHTNLLFALNTSAEPIPAPERLAEARRYGAAATARAGRPPAPIRRRDPDRLRIGFVSADLGDHPVGYFIESVLAALAADAASRIDAVLYLNTLREEPATARIVSHAAASHRVHGLSDAALAAQVRADGLDVLIDLSGHTAGNRLPMFAHRPAPVQASWIGYFATTGVEQIDFFLADPHIAPLSEDAHFTERLWRLPNSVWCFTPPTDEIAVGPSPALAQGLVTFGSFGALNKMSDTVVAVWARVLEAAPNSRLLLKSGGLDDAAARTLTLERFAAHGVGADRLILEGRSPRADYLRAYGRVDIVLDTFPYPGGTTSAESLWMGVPVLTMNGERLLARNGVSIARNAGLEDWIAADADDYVRRAARHAGDIDGLARLRIGLRAQVLASPLFDAKQFARDFEAALWNMWRQDA